MVEANKELLDCLKSKCVVFFVTNFCSLKFTIYSFSLCGLRHDAVDDAVVFFVPRK